MKNRNASAAERESRAGFHLHNWKNPQVWTCFFICSDRYVWINNMHCQVNLTLAALTAVTHKDYTRQTCQYRKRGGEKKKQEKTIYHRKGEKGELPQGYCSVEYLQ